MLAGTRAEHSLIVVQRFDVANHDFLKIRVSGIQQPVEFTWGQRRGNDQRKTGASFYELISEIR